MKKLLLTALLLTMCLTACNTADKTKDIITENQVEETAEEETTEEITKEEAIEETTKQEEPTSSENTDDISTEVEKNDASYEDNFVVPAEVSAAYGAKIKEAVANKDMEMLADLTGFPVYVGFPEEGLIINTRDEFVALGAERIFTEELTEAIANTDENDCAPSMAGFTLYYEDGAPSITYSVQEGKLVITGINY